MTEFVDDVPVYNWDQMNKKTRVLRVIVYEPGGLGEPADYLSANGEFIMFQGSEPAAVTKTMSLFEDSEGRVIAEARIGPSDWPANGLYRHESKLTDSGGHTAAILKGQVNVQHSGFEN